MIPIIRTSAVTIACLLVASSSAHGEPSAGLERVSVKLIWNEAHYNAFVDLIRFHDKWFCSFREGKFHVAKPGKEDDGKIRVISSSDGEAWTSAALLDEPGVDLRDPKLSITPDGRLMIVAGGSQYPGGIFKGRQSRVMFSADGSHWTKPQPVVKEGQWLWRVTWQKGKAYGIAYYGSPGPYRQDLVESDDGIHWNVVTELKVPGGGEATVRFPDDDRMMILMRRVPALADRKLSVPPPDTRSHAWIGISEPPYHDFQWRTTGHMVGGPNFIVLPSGKMVGGGRSLQNNDPKMPRTGLGFLTPTSLEPELWLPSGGDNSYPGLVYHDNLLWVAYYSSHGGNPAIYLAKIRVR